MAGERTPTAKSWSIAAALMVLAVLLVIAVTVLGLVLLVR